MEVDCTNILAECSELPAQPAEQRRPFSAWGHPLGMRLSSITSQGGIQAVTASALEFFFPSWVHNNNLGKTGASEPTVLAAPASVMLWQYGVGCHLAHFFQSLLQLSGTMAHSERSKSSVRTEKTASSSSLRYLLFHALAMVSNNKNEL